MGQLIGMLVKGDATRRVRAAEVRSLDCGDHLKEIVYRCIGERRKRYQSQSGASAKVTVVVRGRPNALQAAGKDGGRKLLEIKRLREKELRMALLSEAQFWRLAGRPARTERP